MRFPALATKKLPRGGRELTGELTRIVEDPRWAEGYLRVRIAGGDDLFLFVHQSKAHFAGALEEERFVSRSFLDLFESVPQALGADYYATDQGLLLAIAVPFRKAPSSQLAAGAVTAEALDAQVKKSMQVTGGRDAVLALRRGDAVSLALCRGGEPAWLYAAPDEGFPAEGTASQRIAAYVTSYRDVSVDVFDEVFLPAAEGAGRPFRSYLDDATDRALMPAGLVPSLAVYMGTRVVYRYIMDKDQIRVGRGGENDLALDNLSVSRKHATIRRNGERLVINDLGSENGVLSGGKSVQELEMKPGDRVEIGKYTLIYDHYAPRAQASQNPAAKVGRAVEETLGLGASNFRTAVFRHAGVEHRMSGMVFHIGKASDAHLRISGLFVAPIHVRIVRDTSGVHRATHVGGSRPMRVNGKPEKEVVLKNGDEISVAGSVVQFALEAPAAAAQARLGPR